MPDQFEYRQFRSIVAAQPHFDNSGIAAGAIGKFGRDFRKQLVQNIFIVNEPGNRAAIVTRIDSGFGNQPLYRTPNRLCLGQSRV